MTGCFASFELPSGGRLAQEFFDVLGKLLTLLGELGSIGVNSRRVFEALIELK